MVKSPASTGGCWPEVTKKMNNGQVHVVPMVFLLFSLLLLLIGALVLPQTWFSDSALIKSATNVIAGMTTATEHFLAGDSPPVSSLYCPAGEPPSCSSSPPPPPAANSSVTSASCPSYFRWIHEDLRPWSETGITKDMVDRAAKTSNFRLTIAGGRAYVERYSPAFQTRDVFTLWGILQLLRRYPGRVPDLDFAFNCDDSPVVKAAGFRRPGSPSPPPLFRYCKDASTLDIVFPDWSFWGWPEVNIKPWNQLILDLKKGNERTPWAERVPYAYWKGNPSVSRKRRDLLRCNSSRKWSAQLYRQDWVSETKVGFKDSDLASQCTHRYKIYIEGRAWSVSEKYILACDSPMLLVRTTFFDFFTRGLVPLTHYWPIRDEAKCNSIKFAVDYGNANPNKARDIGKAGSRFIQESLNMDHVYDYMLHLLTEYAKLLRYKPSKPVNSTEYCIDSMACATQGLVKKFLVDSMVDSSSYSSPCSMPPPFEPGELESIAAGRANRTMQVEKMEVAG